MISRASVSFLVGLSHASRSCKRCSSSSMSLSTSYRKRNLIRRNIGRRDHLKWIQHDDADGSGFSIHNLSFEVLLKGHICI